MNFKNVLIVIGLSGLLFGCHSGSVTYESETYYHEDTVATPPRYDVSLHQFNMIDSYGINTEFDRYEALAINPFVNHGFFDVVWDVSTHGGYYVSLFVNDIPTSDGGRKIFDDYCSYGLLCDSRPYRYCDFTPGLDIHCEAPNGDVQANYVGDMLYRAQEDLFLVLEVCDATLYYCESQALPVIVEH